MTNNYAIHSDIFEEDGLCKDSGKDESQFRLNMNVKPLHYDLVLCPTVGYPFDMNGTVLIDLQVNYPTDHITLNSYGLKIISTELAVSLQKLKKYKKLLSFYSREILEPKLSEIF